MTAFNIVRFKVKPGRARAFINAHRGARLGARGFKGGVLVRTGARTFCIIGEWSSFGAMARARPQMISILDTFRKHLAKVGPSGVTDPVSGQQVLKLRGSQSRRAQRKKTRRKVRRKSSRTRRKRRS
ncbi:MAG: DUF718 domain-containing protein [Pseudolabrys sp.]|nr:DUF718 domain-containing protein [Pseudolabrys sp.]